MSSKRQSLRAFQNDRNSLCVAGFALMRIVEVYKEIQEQEMNIVSTFFFYTFFLVFRICRRCCWKFNRKIFSDNIFVPLTWPVFLFSFYFSFFFLERREGECNRILLSREVATRNLCGVSKEECSRLFWSRLFRSMDIS